MNRKFLGILYRLTYPLLQFYWFIFRPRTSGVRCLIRHQDKFLFIFNTYRPHWNIVGGGIEPGETPTHAVIREVFEETGLHLKDPEYIGRYISRQEYKVDTVHCFFATTTTNHIQTDPAEIAGAVWQPLSHPPSPACSGVGKIIDLYRHKHAP